MYKIIMAPTDGSDAELPALGVAVIFGSVADEITRSSPTSVLVVHPRESAG